MSAGFTGMTALAVLLALSMPATAPHSQAMYFDINKAITLEGEIVRVEWVNPQPGQ